MRDAKQLVNDLRRIAKISYGATIEEARSVSNTQREAADMIERLLAAKPLANSQTHDESATHRYSKIVKWPEGYCLDPNGVMCCPEGKYEDWSFGYDLGYADAMAVRSSATPTGADAATPLQDIGYEFGCPAGIKVTEWIRLMMAHKHTPLRVDWMGGYVCLTCIDSELEARARDDKETLLSRIRALASLGVSYGLLADDQCSQIVNLIDNAAYSVPAAGNQAMAPLTSDSVERALDRVLKQSKNPLFRSGAKICAAEILSPTKRCTKAPEGWSCSRVEGHEGPCAASQSTNGEAKS